MSSLNLAKNVLMISQITSRDHPGDYSVKSFASATISKLSVAELHTVQQQGVQHCLREDLGK